MLCFVLFEVLVAPEHLNQWLCYQEMKLYLCYY